MSGVVYRMNRFKIRSVSLLSFLCLILIISTVFCQMKVKAHTISDEHFRNDINDYPFTADGIVLMDAKTGKVLFSKNEQQTFYPASITKIITALIALESQDMQDVVTTSEIARHVEGSRIYLAEGEKKPLKDLLYGIMLNSGNDAAIAIAEHIGGSVEHFAEMMNEKAKEWGATDTHFVNPNGLHDDAHYTTALDMALIAQEALKNPQFRQIVQTKELPWHGEDWQSKLINTNKLLWEYDGMTGIKTGYTSEARQTFVGSAQRGDTELIAVLLKADTRDQLWSEAQALLDYGFANYETVKVKSAGDPVPVLFHGEEYAAELKDDLYVTLEKNAQPEWEERIQTVQLTPYHPPLPKGSKIGEFILHEDGEPIGQADLVLSQSVSYVFSDAYIERVKADGLEQGSFVQLAKNFWLAPLVLVVFFAVLRVRRNIKAKRSVRRHIARRYSKWGSNHWPPA